VFCYYFKIIFDGHSGFEFILIQNWGRNFYGYVTSG